METRGTKEEYIIFQHLLNRPPSWVEFTAKGQLLPNPYIETYELKDYGPA